LYLWQFWPPYAHEGKKFWRFDEERESEPRFLREKGEQNINFCSRERKSMKNEGKMVVVALNSPCGY